MCKYKNSENFCVISKKECNKNSDEECIIYISYEEMIRE